MSSHPPFSCEVRSRTAWPVRVDAGTETYAVRCFTRTSKEVAQRYEAIAHATQQLRVSPMPRAFLPFDYQAQGVSVEGELGCLGSLESGHGEQEDGHGAEGSMTREQLLTDPEQAADFVRRTQLDALAIAIGTSHGAYKFSRKPTGDILAIDRIREIHRRIPNTHLVMHGSSSVPQDLLAEIRQYGGAMKETYGVPVEEIQEAIRHGVRKINIDTDIRLAMTAAIRRFMAEHPDKFDPREYLKPARDAARRICLQRYREFGCEGQGSRIAPIPLSMMVNRYSSGELSQTAN
jgi:fructose-bisphosphate aldolase class II